MAKIAKRTRHNAKALGGKRKIKLKAKKLNVKKIAKKVRRKVLHKKVVTKKSKVQKAKTKKNLKPKIRKEISKIKKHAAKKKVTRRRRLSYDNLKKSKPEKKITKRPSLRPRAKRRGSNLGSRFRGNDTNTRLLRRSAPRNDKKAARNDKKNVKKAVKKIVKLVKIKGFAPRKKRKITEVKPGEFDSEALFKAKIKVIGIGGGGGSIVSEIGRSLEKATFVIADTDARALKKKSGIKYFCFGQELTHGLGTGVNVELAKQAAEAAKEKISSNFKEQDIIIFVASLGGGLGSGATQVFAEEARKFGGITMGIFTMPFKFEGKIKQRIALSALKALKQSLNVSLVIPNERIFKVIDPSAPITSAFSTVNKSLIESLESLIDLIYNPGIINIDFADLRTILRGRGSSAFLNTAEESGKNRAEKICEKVLVNPLLQNNNFEAQKILFNVAGAENLSMFEVEKISNHIAGLNPKAKIIFGISKDNKLRNKIKTTILMTSGQLKEEVSEKIAEPEPAEISAAQKIPMGEKEESKKPAKKKMAARKPKEKVNKKPEKPKKEKASEPASAEGSGPLRQRPSEASEAKGEVPISIVPVLEMPIPQKPMEIPVLEQKKMEIVETQTISARKAIRRSGLEIRRAEEQAEKKKLAQEKEWEIPAFMRKMKIKN